MSLNKRNTHEKQPNKLSLVNIGDVDNIESCLWLNNLNGLNKGWNLKLTSKQMKCKKVCVLKWNGFSWSEKVEWNSYQIKDDMWKQIMTVSQFNEKHTVKSGKHSVWITV